MFETDNSNKNKLLYSSIVVLPTGQIKQVENEICSCPFSVRRRFFFRSYYQLSQKIMYPKPFNKKVKSCQALKTEQFILLKTVSAFCHCLPVEVEESKQLRETSNTFPMFVLFYLIISRSIQYFQLHFPNSKYSISRFHHHAPYEGIFTKIFPICF